MANRCEARLQEGCELSSRYDVVALDFVKKSPAADPKASGSLGLVAVVASQGVSYHLAFDFLHDVPHPSFQFWVIRGLIVKTRWWMVFLHKLWELLLSNWESRALF